MSPPCSSLSFASRRRLGLSAIGSAVLLSLLGSATAAAVDYEREIKPLLKQRCYACHGALKQKAGLRLDTAAAIRKGGDAGPAITPRHADHSLLIAKVAAGDPAARMPREGEPLSAEQIALLRAWIDQGAKAPRDEQPETDPRKHWAFQPVVRPPVPTIRHPPSAVRHPVDAFLDARLAAARLTPLPPAPKHLLLRRVYLDLIGLPPTRQELRAFLADPSPDAYERVVNRLLDDPRHGERWARHWMDVWRYSDWFGRRMVPDVWNSAPQIWRWRDWIVRSLNADKGYDRMVKEMLAADEIAPLDDETVVATGFLIRNWYALNPNEWMRANVEHTGKAFLGLTFQCAHCHDHKYDPITQEDYFAFRAFFEPLYVRQDRWPGEPDPGPFQDYEYSKLRKVQRLGMVRVFDRDTAAKTWLYTGGDERHRLTNRPPVKPAMPAFLGGEKLNVNSIQLPAEAFYPGLRTSVQEEELARVERALAAARARAAKAESDHANAAPETKPARERALRATELEVQTAEAERASVLARITADKARFGATRIARQDDSVSIHADEPARAASKAERQFKLAAAKEGLWKAEIGLDDAQQKLADAKDDKAKETANATVKKAEQQLEAAKKTLADAEAGAAKENADYTPFGPVYPKESTGRRAALAEWIASRDNPLAARVAVNHVWLRHFHEPLVASVYDFGRNGRPPTHPALLDWLAAEFMDCGWSMKHLHRLIVTSAAYRRKSAAGAPAIADPENRLLWRMNTGRMEAEVVRDSILHLAGALDGRMGGQELENKDALSTTRRSLYYSCNPEGDGRSEFGSLFDAPDPNECYRRTRSIVPQQALALTNSRLVHDHAQSLAKRLASPVPSAAPGGDAGFITAAFEQILSRPPGADELAECVSFLARQREAAAGDGEARARESLVRALFNHNDFLTIR